MLDFKREDAPTDLRLATKNVEDALIAAHAKHANCLLVTRDKDIRNSPEVKTMWDDRDASKLATCKAQSSARGVHQARHVHCLTGPYPPLPALPQMAKRLGKEWTSMAPLRAPEVGVTPPSSSNNSSTQSSLCGVRLWCCSLTQHWW